jgi:hypothetical protein
MTLQARPSVRCRKLLLELSRYLDGELTPARRRTVEQHVAACECCGTMAARLRKTIAACRVEGGRRPPRDVISRASARIRALIAQVDSWDALDQKNRRLKRSCLCRACSRSTVYSPSRRTLSMSGSLRK